MSKFPIAAVAAVLATMHVSLLAEDHASTSAFVLPEAPVAERTKPVQITKLAGRSS
jgi:hypothetical protein